jgi:hypothetical protein
MKAFEADQNSWAPRAEMIRSDVAHHHSAKAKALFEKNA